MSQVLKIDLKGKIIVITGGYGYLGKAISESLAAHGAVVEVIGRSNEKFEEAFNKSEFKENIFFCKGDISNVGSIKKNFKKIYNEHGKLDVLINNAFYLRGQSPTEMSSEDFTYSLEGCLTANFNCIREILPFMHKEGKIINVSSIYGIVSPDFEVYEDSPNFLNPPHYGAAKAGIIQLTKYYASYLGKKGITVNAVTPGPFPSKEVQKDTEFIEKLKQKTILNKIGEPEEVAGAFVFLSSGAAKYITGQNIIVDGGWTIK